MKMGTVEMRQGHNSEVNCDPLSDVISVGMPKRAIQWSARAFVHVADCATSTGMAYRHG